MTPVTCFEGKRVAVIGLGGSGLASARALIAGGAEVACWDDGSIAVEAARAVDLPVVDLSEADFSAFDALLLAPGIPLTHPKPHWSVLKAKAARIEILGDIELFCRERREIAPDAPFVAITGTNGKSTTTALIAHLLTVDGWDVQLGGNIGTAILALEPPSENRVHVIECSSFQIDLAPSIDPTVAVLLNVTEDHLDRHGTIEHYAAVKARLLGHAGTAIVGIDDEWSTSIADSLIGQGKKVVRFTVRRPVTQGYYADKGRIFEVEAAVSHQIADLTGIGALRGQHNAQNATAAVAAAKALAVAEPVIAKGLKSFPGLAHRMEQVGRVGRVLFVNDSKATNADAAEKALSSFGRIYWIAGGRPKTGGIASLAPLFPRVAHAFLIGEAAPDFADTLAAKKVPHEISGTLDKAVKAALAAAAADEAAEPVVLLSPACSSFDQFRNFEKRGEAFKALVAALPGFKPIEGGK
ncbi:UDP-N-acetylmuramoyl-L-alanine--D-glutamate ligase [Prosthecomicrobium pneumaticum]|uniref:UDP-N-acetylmuramoylalanine--D-glutamate ligase n=1 Tax=Prosthecomicrobium pneumaticum TaxID=81895 RepID=A0A7W9FLS4_9HYPH|nr:UDP-N-acetylmuramoyl-L-alanine--D-glutamate ligase [Prosthecomicrobium pneumaticum]MBB5753019.1 UDP-N-acetylmuramoylalanine--D-glutamate ligase [Prosthecomicrobium pneumaticum]